MKNQYFGDINDFLKYGLLRSIGRETGLRIAVCWMLTQDDGRPDGKKIAYLDQAAKWRHYDPALFDALRDAVQSGHRDIGVVETGQILPGAVYHSDLLTDNRRARSQYFDRLATCSCEMVFFDPDNGMEVKSKPLCRKNSSKYLYWDEARRFAAMGKSLIIYQHFTRMKREDFIAGLRQRFCQETSARWVGVLVTANVAYFVIPAPPHEQALWDACGSVSRHLSPHVQLA